VTSLPDDAWHRNVDKIVLAAPEGIKTAIVAPPAISGKGRGPGNQRSIQWYGLAKASLERGKAFYVGEGKNLWNWVHVHDLSRLYLILMENAMEGVAGHQGEKATWGKEGYYFAETGLFVWGDVAKLIGKAGKELGVFKSEEADGLDKEEVEKWFKGGALQSGLNSKSKAIRANKLFGWEPKEKDMDGLIYEIVKGEALDLGLLKTHAQEAAGI
jgi:nucleoside-diphosphate-sugar epimerase